MRKTSDFLLKNGFSLTELLIVVVMIAILATIAVPAYLSHIRKTRRHDAIGNLLHMQLAEARYRTSNTSYATLAQLGVASSSDYYDYSITNVSSTTYTLTATAKSGTTQTSDVEGATSCSPLTLNQSNTKSPSVCWPT